MIFHCLILLSNQLGWVKMPSELFFACEQGAVERSIGSAGIQAAAHAWSRVPEYGRSYCGKYPGD
jgi:hypothetical protein